jgi:hypothetical protein
MVSRVDPPSETLWMLTKDGRRFSCLLRSHGKYGWECQFVEGEAVVDDRRFAMRSQALEWAAHERQEHEDEGWTVG